MTRTSVTDERFITTGSLKFWNLLPLLKRIVLEMISEFNILLKNNKLQYGIILLCSNKCTVSLKGTSAVGASWR